MKKPQLFLVIGALVLLLALYFGGNMVPPAKKHEHKTAENSAPQKVDFEQLQAKALMALDSLQRATVKGFEGKTDKASIVKLAEVWSKAKQGNMSAKYKADLAKLENTEKSLTFASQYYIDLYNIEQDTATKVWQASQAAELLQKVLAMNPANENAKVMLAQSYTDGTGETMKGVLMLREVAEKNPENLSAGVTLGRLAIQSGQWDKAITRLEKLLSTHKKEKEVLYFLAEAYKGKGNTDKAKALFTECKQLVNNPDFSKEIDEYIKTF
jgi:lipopolysaccharide biosynthesis regulator YciM